MTLKEAVALVPPGCDWSINSRHHASVWEAEKGLHWWTVQDDNVVEALAKAAKQARIALGIDRPPNPDFRAGVEKLRDRILEVLEVDCSSSTDVWVSKRLEARAIVALIDKLTYRLTTQSE